jgi:hypothetical protein
MFVRSPLINDCQEIQTIMDTSLLSVGAYQPIPFPAPIGLLKTLLVFGFFLHVIPMNVTLTGTLVSAILLLMGGKDESAYTTRAGRQLAASLPIFTTAAITNGILPLLFLQVLYGPLVYTSSIIMALPWFAVLFLIIFAYYGLYIYNYGKQKMSLTKAPWVLIGSSLLFMLVAFIFSNNMTLMLTPEKFLSLYQNSTAGANMNLTEPTLLPRYLHFVGAAFAVTSLMLGCFGLFQQKNGDKDYGNWLVKLGASGYAGVTLVQTLVGFWFLWSTPEGFQQWVYGTVPAGTPDNLVIMAKMTSHLFKTSMGLEVLSLLAMGYAATKASGKAYKVGLVSAVGVIAAMVVMRHQLRVFMTDDAIGQLMAAQPVVIQWPILIVFFVLFAGMIGYFAWLTKTVMRAYTKA